MDQVVKSLTLQLKRYENKEIEKKVQYINKHGNDTQRQAVKRKDLKVVNKIYDVVHDMYTTKEMSPSFPPPMNQSPTMESGKCEVLQRKYDVLYEAHEKLLEATMELEAEIIDLRKDIDDVHIIKDYTTLRGSDITPEELDRAKLSFVDPDTYHRLMIEYQRHQNSL